MKFKSCSKWMSLLDSGLGALAIRWARGSVLPLIVRVSHQVACENRGQCKSAGVSPDLNFMGYPGFLTMVTCYINTKSDGQSFGTPQKNNKKYCLSRIR